jgi:hypothetical protein
MRLKHGIWSQVGDLEHSIRKLQLEMQRQTADISRLDQVLLSLSPSYSRML